MFNFVVTYLGFLKRIPLLPHIFDACFRVHTILFNKKRSEAMDIIESTVSSWNGISVTIHKYGGVQFNYKSKEIGHMHGNGMVDILLDRKTKKQLISKNMVKEHHVFKESG